MRTPQNKMKIGQGKSIKSHRKLAETTYNHQSKSFLRTELEDNING